MAVAVVVPEDLVATARADCTEAACVRVLTVMRATGMIATSAMRVRMAPPFVGRAKRLPLLGVGGLRPLHTVPGRRAGRLRPSWLHAIGCAAGVSYAQDCVVGTSLVSVRVSRRGSLGRWLISPRVHSQVEGLVYALLRPKVVVTPLSAEWLECAHTWASLQPAIPRV